MQIQGALIGDTSRLLSLENQRLANRINLYLSLGADYEGPTPKAARAGSVSSEE
jgi:hypothetical protein